MWKRLAFAAALAGCGNRSKLDGARDTDALWDLAPDHTQIGIVVSPRGMDLALRGAAAIGAVATQPDFAPARAEIESALTSVFGSPAAKVSDLGFATDKGFALFVADGGMLAILPVADRDKLVAAKHGKRGSDADTIEDDTCKPLRGLYVCATTTAMFQRLGKGSLRGRVALAGGRGDAELFAPGFSILGGTGDLAIAAELEVGTVSVRGTWSGQATGTTIGKVAGTTAPKVDATGASGFTALDIGPFVSNLPPVPLAGGVTMEELGKTIVGPVSIVVPSGTLDLEARIPLTDPAPAKQIIDHCSELSFLTTTPGMPAGECWFQIQAVKTLQLSMWVEGKDLRIGTKDRKPLAGKAGSTAIGDELARGTWTAVFWGRGSMLNLGDASPTEVHLPPEGALGVHALAMVSEAGGGVRLDKQGATFRAYVRTAWANPPEVFAQVSAVSADAIAGGAATSQGKAIAAKAPGSPFATDFPTGQGGLIVPAGVIGFFAATVVPMLSLEAQQPLPARGVDKAQLAQLLVRGYALEAYPAWAAANPSKVCPASLAELAGFLGMPSDIPTLVDPWDHPLILKCDGKQATVISAGPDGQQNTADDIRP